MQLVRIKRLKQCVPTSVLLTGFILYPCVCNLLVAIVVVLHDDDNLNTPVNVILIVVNVEQYILYRSTLSTTHYIQFPIIYNLASKFRNLKKINKSSVLVFLCRNSKHYAKKCKKIAFVLLLCSVLENAAIVWDSYLPRDIDTLEIVQKSCQIHTDRLEHEYQDFY